MHLPDGIIPLNQSIVYWIISIIILGLFFYKISKQKDIEKRVVLISVLSAATIIASSISIPSPFGVPIHFFLIPLVVIILGPLNGSFVSFISLVVQFLFLGMGGLTTLAANFIVMGVILSLGTYVFYSIISNLNKKIAIFAGTIIGIILAAISQIIILIISGTGNFEMLIITLLPFYMFIAIIEGLATTLIITFIEKTRPELLKLDKI